MDRNTLRQVSADTVKSMERGQTKGGISLQTEYHTQFIPPKESIDISSKEKTTPNDYYVYNESVIKTILDHKHLENLAVLVFASAKHPCGGFLNGAMAQEEAIAYSSTLYGQQTNQEGQKFYDYHRNHPNKYYHDGLLIGDIEVFKDDQYQELSEAISVKAVTSPAVNLRYLEQSGKDYSLEEANKIMLHRMERVIDLCIAHDCKNIILGAFGCGVFGNKPENIAELWYEILETKGKKQYFQQVMFSVLDTKTAKNCEVFRKTFQK